MSIERLQASLADRYRLERELGQGGMATVYLAEDLKHKRKVALKVLKPELAAVLGADRFVQEITTTAALQHPHILPLFDSGTADGFLYYVMPYIQGETLRSKLDRETQLGIEEAVKITVDVADALDYAHSQGVVHRDIKPENILLHNGRPMVADFGIALALSAAAGGRMTETGLSLGTPHYMSPEQATAEKEITARSDIYSLGSVLYEMLTGSPPHVGASAQQIIMKIVTEEAAPVTKLRKAVPPNVAAAVAKALEKLPADRFATAKEFAEALTNPGFTTAAVGMAGGATSGAGSWLRDRRTQATLLLTALAVATLAWSLTRTTGVPGPSEYDVALPDSAVMGGGGLMEGFAVSPGGDFLVYQAVGTGPGTLWYRSLLDGSARPINGTENAFQPSIAPTGERVAFLRDRGEEWTIETMSLDGGEPVTLGRGSGDIQMDWLADGRIQVVEGDGSRVRWFDPAGGPTVSRSISYCIMVAQLADPDWRLCGGGGDKFAYAIDLRDSTVFREFWTATRDSMPVFGSDFELVEGRYLVYLSMGGDLMAAPIDLASREVGRSVRMVTGLGRRQYTGAGTYAIAASGTLVYAAGVNQAVGHLVRVRENGLDTLRAGREPFLRFAVTADGRRLAAVVEGPEGEELRIYDLETGRHVMWVRRPEVRQPVWSPRGDQVLFTNRDTLFLGSPDLSEPPAPIMTNAENLEVFTWMPDDRVFGQRWGTHRAVVLHVTQRPVVVDTLMADVTFPKPSPDGRWIAYGDKQFTTIWVEPLPRDGRRYQVASGSVDEVAWRSASDLVAQSYLGDKAVYELITLDHAREQPIVSRRPWLETPEFLGTAGQSYLIAPGGGLLYVRGTAEQPVRYLRVIPNWVTRMKQAVDEANR